jgi:ribosomal-protein-alanine N-acetyltransferase
MQIPPFTNLTTARLFLRELKQDDAAEIFRLRSDSSVNEFVERSRAVSLADAEEFIQKIIAIAESQEGIMWAITLIGDNKLIGTVCYWNIEPGKNKAELGYELLPEYQGKGIMTEAVEKVIAFGFEQMKLERTVAEPRGDNNRSIKLLEKMGFRLSGKDGDYLIYELRLTNSDLKI